jgi:FRG domain
LGTEGQLSVVNGIETYRPDTWSELHDALFADPWPEFAGQYHSSMIHRGLSNADYQMKSSLQRMGGDFRNLERYLLRNFRKYARTPSTPPTNPWEWLTIAQHFGLPTRLLDWTYSPLVALHFATSKVDAHTIDGAVWSVDFARVRELLPEALHSTLIEEGAYAFTTEMLAKAAPTLFEIDRLSHSTNSFMVILEPPSLDERIVNQYAGFSFMSPPDVDTDYFLAFHDPALARKVIIPKELKPVVRERLDQANINERVLFPGLDGLSRWLTRYYTSGPRSSYST